MFSTMPRLTLLFYFLDSKTLLMARYMILEEITLNADIKCNCMLVLGKLT
jgi:hypothetical protein